MKAGSRKKNGFEQVLRVGPFRVCFSGIKPIYYDVFLKRYSHFLASDENYNFKILIEEKDKEFLNDETGYLRLEEILENGRKTLLSTTFKGYEADRDGISLLCVSPENNETIYFTGIENHFRWVVAQELLKNDGFLLHSSGIAREDECSLFFGSSGDGKSTVAEFGKRKGGKILSDDLIIVYPDRDSFIAYGAPFYGVLPQCEKELNPYKIKSVYKLIKSEKTELKPLSKAQALGYLLSHCQFVFSKKVRNEILVPIVVKFLKSVSSYELYFRKDDSFLELI